MMRRAVWTIVVALAPIAAAFAAGPAPAQQFSADLVSRVGKTSAPAQKIFVSDSKVRVETGDANGSIIIADSGAGATFMVVPPQRIYIETTNATAAQMARLFHPADPEDPCTEWLKMVQERGPGATCTRIGEDKIDGRQTIKFEGVSPEHEHGFAWIDPALHFVIKVEGAGGDGMVLRNITEGPQAPDLFVIPADFRKIEPQTASPPKKPPAQ